MARLPVVAIIGRPNTGKSTLFNRMIGRRMAIESNVAGTTRDHIAGRIDGQAVDYLLLDTGGMGGGTEDKDFEDDVHAQSLLALKAADLIVFTVDGTAEITASDRTIAGILRKQKKGHVPVILVLTKCDTDKRTEDAIHAFHELGLSENIVPTSAAHNLGTAELQDAIEEQLRALHFEKDRPAVRPDGEETDDAINPATGLRASQSTPRIAIVGKPNVGKSSLINGLMSDPQRELSPRLVSDIPGTTRDSTDVVIKREGEEFVFVDTAGMRRPARVEEDLEGLAVLRTIQAIEHCDVALLTLDAKEPVSQQDQRIASLIVGSGKGIIILINKIDLLKGEERKEKLAEIRSQFLFCRYAPVLPVSAKNRENLPKIFALASMVHRNRLRRLPEKDLQEFYKNAVHGQPMSALQEGRHITQGENPPPAFFITVRDPRKVQLTQLRYLENRLRETFGLEGTPVQWITKRAGRGRKGV